MPDMASTSRMPIGGSATWSSKVWLPSRMMPPTGTTAKVTKAGTTERYGRQLEGEGVRLVGEQVFLEDQLGAVGQRLQQAPGPGPVGPDAALHVRDHLALEPDHHGRGHQQHDEGDQHLDDDDEQDFPVDPVDEEGVAGPGSGVVRARRSEGADHTDSSRTSVTGLPAVDEGGHRVTGRLGPGGHVEVDGDGAPGHAVVGLGPAAPARPGPSAPGPGRPSWRPSRSRS